MTYITDLPGEPARDLTALDVKALRQADDLAFYRKADGTGLIKAIKRADRLREPFAEDREYDIPVEANGGNGAVASPYKTGYAYHGSYRYGSLWTVIQSLRKGDRVRLIFYADAHTNDYVRDAGLHADVLYLRVFRNGKTLGEYVAVTSITPDNSARMVR